MKRQLAQYLFRALAVVAAVGLVSAFFVTSGSKQQDGQALVGGNVNPDANTLLVFAAASLSNVMADIIDEFERVHGHRPNVALAGSSILARQIEHGAPADVFLSANSDWMDYLAQRELIDVASRENLLSNQLVLIEHAANLPAALPRVATPSNASAKFGAQLHGRLNSQRLAVALVDAVPAGIYAKAVLQSLDLWEHVKENVVQTDNVRAALALVATGEARYGIVYVTDVAPEDRVSIVMQFPHQLHPAIVYPVAKVTASQHSQALSFIQFLHGVTAQQIFARHGFMQSRL